MPNLDKALSELAKLPRHSNEDTAWIVLTGAPSAGKSTLLDTLRSKGYSTQREQARELFEQELAAGKSMREITASPEMLVKGIFERNLRTHAATSRLQVTVFDRGLPDVLAFGLADRVDIEPYIRECSSFRFVTAFVFERVPAIPDRLIYHSPSQLHEIELACEGIYRALGANVRRLPAFSNDKSISASQRLAVIEQEIRLINSRVNKLAIDDET
jgi:predicted ATPase